MINLAHSCGVEELPLFQHFRNTKSSLKFFECLGKDNKCSGSLLGENVFGACMERQLMSN